MEKRCKLALNDIRQNTTCDSFPGYLQAAFFLPVPRPQRLSAVTTRKPPFLRAERQAGGRRIYKLKEAKALQRSFGEDLYREIFEQNRCE